MSKLILKSPYISYGKNAVGCASYIATRDGVDLQKTTEALEHYPRKAWTHILSLRREDAARLGYDHAEPWRNLLKAHRNGIAAAMKISLDNFRWFAAFHDEDTHPHVHMMAWSADPAQGYLTRAGAYELARCSEFPTLTIGTRIVVPKDKFIRWIEGKVSEKSSDIR